MKRRVHAVWRTTIEGTDCMESEKEIGYYSHDYDIRPSSCYWIKKRDCPRLRKIFKVK